MVPESVFCSTLPKIFLPFILLIDLLTRSSLYGSPSSTSNSPLITESFVTVFPAIFIFSIMNFLPSKILIFTSTPLPSKVSKML